MCPVVSQVPTKVPTVFARKHGFFEISKGKVTATRAGARRVSRSLLVVNSDPGFRVSLRVLAFPRTRPRLPISGDDASHRRDHLPVLLARSLNRVRVDTLKRDRVSGCRSGHGIILAVILGGE